MARSVVFSPEALADLIEMYEYIAPLGGDDRAIGYIGRIEVACRSLAQFPERGVRRDDLRPGLRVLGFERRAVIAFQLGADTVTILRILYGGRAVDAALTAPP